MNVGPLRADGVATGDIIPPLDMKEADPARRKLPLLVQGGLPGETGQARIMHVGKHQAIARMIALQTGSADRRGDLPCHRWTPDSPCRVMHLGDGAQRTYKRQQIMRAFSDAGVTDVPVSECRAPSASMGTRSKVSFVVARRRGEIVLGAFRRASHLVQPMVDCGLPEPALQEATRAILTALNLGACPIANPALRVAADGMCGRPDDDWSGRAPARPEVQLVQEGLRYLVMRANRKGEVVVLMLTPSGKLAFAEQLAAAARELFRGFTGFYLGPSGSGNTLVGDRSPVPIGEAQPLEEELDGLIFEVSPHSFFQVNRDAAGALHREVVERSVGERILDLYCGVGAISLRLAKGGAKVVGVESNRHAVYAAQRAATRNALEGHTRFEAGDASTLVKAMRGSGEAFDTVVLNPPRRGCDAEVLEGITALSPQRIVYVSCNPKTLARDTAGLFKLGWRCESIVPYDLFPHSEHVEALAVFTAKGGE